MKVVQPQRINIAESQTEILQKKKKTSSFVITRASISFLIVWTRPDVSGKRSKNLYRFYWAGLQFLHCQHHLWPWLWLHIAGKGTTGGIKGRAPRAVWGFGITLIWQHRDEVLPKNILEMHEWNQRSSVKNKYWLILNRFIFVTRVTRRKAYARKQEGKKIKTRMKIMLRID